MKLTEEIEIKSIFYGSISIKDSQDYLKWDKWKKPDFFSNSKTTSYLVDKIDIREKNINTSVDFIIPEEYSFVLTKEAANLFSYDNISIILSYCHNGKVIGTNPFFLVESQLREYNIIIGENQNKVENSVLKDTDRAGQNSVWWYPIMFIPVLELDKNPNEWLSKNMDFLLDQTTFSTVSYTEALGYVGWDFAVFFYDYNQPQIIENIDFFLKITSLEYHCLTETSGRIIDLITNDKLSSNKKTDQCYSIYKDFFNALSLLDKNIISYLNADRELLTNLSIKWEIDSFIDRVSNKVDKMNQLYLYEADKIEKEDSENLNRTVYLIAIIGIAGTVAGILSTIDSTNETFNSNLRTWIIILSTFLSGLLFTYLLPMIFNFLRKK